MTTDSKNVPPAGKGGKERTFKFPSAFTVLFAVTVGVWLLAFVVPTGAYKISEKTGGPIPGTYHGVDAGLSFGDRLMQLFLSPVNGLYGIKSATTNFIGPYESGELFGAAGVFLFVLAIGVFITMSMRTGAIDNGIARVAQRYGNRGAVVIALLMVLFSLGGTTEGMAEETLGFYALVVPLMLSLGYDRMVAAATILVGAGLGVLASTVNPFATGVASDAAVPLDERRQVWNLVDAEHNGEILLEVSDSVRESLIQDMNKVKTQPAASLTAAQPGDADLAVQAVEETTITGRQKAVLAVVAFTFAFMIFAIVTWAQVINGPNANSYGWQLDWYFPELAALFIVMSIVVGMIGGLGEKGLTDTLVRGAGDFVGVGLIIVLARGVTVIMNNSQITDTVLHSMENAVNSTSSGVFGGLMFLINVPLAFLVPSTSGHAALAMPILAPLADFANVPRSIVVTAFQSASGVVNLITPTSAVVMGGLALAKVRYDQYLRFIAPLLVFLLVACTLLIAGAAVVS